MLNSSKVALRPPTCHDTLQLTGTTMNHPEMPHWHRSFDGSRRGRGRGFSVSRYHRTLTECSEAWNNDL